MSSSPDPIDLQDISDALTQVATGKLTVAAALKRLTREPAVDRPEPVNLSPPADTEQITLDLDRQRRCGFPEVIYGEGKSVELILDIIRKQQAATQPSLVTRVDAAASPAILSEFPHARFNPLGRTLCVGVEQVPARVEFAHDAIDPEPPHVAVVTAGSTDAPVAEEAKETLAWMGISFRSFYDIGVAGPHRLLRAVPLLRRASAVIVIAGMEGALPAAVGGHLDVPVFAVPTSVGYGATLGGLTPMLGMLSSCASNVAVVNIDAGFKAAYLAGLLTHQLRSQ